MLSVGGVISLKGNAKSLLGILFTLRKMVMYFSTCIQKTTAVGERVTFHQITRENTVG